MQYVGCVYRWEVWHKSHLFILRTVWFFSLGIYKIYLCAWCSGILAQMVKHMPAMQETQFQSLSWEDPLEKEIVTHSSILAWKIPWTEKPGRLHSMGSWSRTWLSDLHTHTHTPLRLEFKIFILECMPSFNIIPRVWSISFTWSYRSSYPLVSFYPKMYYKISVQKPYC